MYGMATNCTRHFLQLNFLWLPYKEIENAFPTSTRELVRQIEKYFAEPFLSEKQHAVCNLFLSLGEDDSLMEFCRSNVSCFPHLATL